MVLRAVIVSLVVSFIFCRILLVLAGSLRLAGKPALKQKQHAEKTAVPHIGGIGMALACMLTVVWCSGSTSILTANPWRGWVIGSSWLLLLGIVDDLIWELPPMVKVIGHLAAAGILMQSGLGVQIARFSPVLNTALTLVWVVGLINALNLLDILDGLAATVVAVAAFMFALIAGSSLLVLIAMSLLGVQLGFLLFNWAPARLYMGDAGSQWLGFTLAALALAVSYASAGREVALATPILILGLPIFDIAFVVWMRLLNRRSPFKKSRDHFALRLLSTGHDARKTSLAMGALAAGFGIAGLFVYKAPGYLGLSAVAVIGMIVLISGVRLARLSVDA